MKKKYLLLTLRVVKGLVASDLRAVFLGLTALASSAITELLSSSESKMLFKKRACEVKKFAFINAKYRIKVQGLNFIFSLERSLLIDIYEWRESEILERNKKRLL